METNESAVDYNPLRVRNLRDARRAPRMLAVLVRRLMSLGGVGAPPLPRPLVFFRACARGLTGLDPLYVAFLSRYSAWCIGTPSNCAFAPSWLIRFDLAGPSAGSCRCTKIHAGPFPTGVCFCVWGPSSSSRRGSPALSPFRPPSRRATARESSQKMRRTTGQSDSGAHPRGLF